MLLKLLKCCSNVLGCKELDTPRHDKGDCWVRSAANGSVLTVSVLPHVFAMF